MQRSILYTCSVHFYILLFFVYEFMFFSIYTNWCSVNFLLPLLTELIFSPDFYIVLKYESICYPVYYWSFSPSIFYGQEDQWFPWCVLGQFLFSFPSCHPHLDFIFIYSYAYATSFFIGMNYLYYFIIFPFFVFLILSKHVIRIW